MTENSDETKWALCFVYQRKKKDKTRTTPDGLKNLASNIVQIYKFGGLDIDIRRISTCNDANGDPNVLATLNGDGREGGAAVYHHNCASRYKGRQVNAWKKKEELNSLDRQDGPSTRKRTSTDSGMGSFQCCICAKEDESSNLHAAGMYHSKKSKPDHQHVKAFTEKLRDMATILEKYFLLNKLAFTDVRANEIYYHGNCLKTLEYDYEKLLKSKDNSDKNESWIKALAFNKVVTFLYERHREDPKTIFKVKDLERRYIDDIASHGIYVVSHTTNFAKKLTDAIDGLEKKSIEKVECTVTFSKTVDDLYWQYHKSPQNFISQLRSVVGQIREDIFQQKNHFDGSFDEDSQVKSVPTSLLILISFIVDGECANTSKYSQVTLTTAQIITSNCRKKKRKNLEDTGSHHSAERETPMMIYMSLKIYATVRCKTLIQKLFELGICVSYTRVLQITKFIYEKLRWSFNLHHTFLPRILKKWIFTTLAKDNIDKNATSTFAKSHCHGTSISVFQFPSSNNAGTELPTYSTPVQASSTNNAGTELPTSSARAEASNKLAPLPKEYTYVEPLPSQPKKRSELFAPVCTVSQVDLAVLDNHHQNSVNEELAWLDSFDFTLVEPSSTTKSWAQHHAQFNRNKDLTPGYNAIMPLLRDPVHTLQMQVHCMKITQKTVKALNPGQTPVDMSDQPVYAITKEAIYRFPTLFPRYFPMMGALHIEQVFLVCHGQLILGSGLSDILKTNSFSLLGTSAVVDVNDIKRGRYCLEVAVCSLYLKLKDAFQNANPGECHLSPMEWLKLRSIESDMCFYWYMVLRMQLDVLIFVRSLREGNFNAYVASMRRLIKWVFIFDHVHYSRWLSVHVFDLTTLKAAHPDLHREFMQGNFSFQKTPRQFSRMATDQAHEQNNKIIKGVGGAAPLLNRSDDSALIRWETCGPEVARVLSEFEETIEINGKRTSRTDEPLKHHEDTPTFRTNYIKDVRTLYEKIHCNPFELNELTMINNTTVVFSSDVVNQVKTIEQEGEKQFLKFEEERLMLSKTSITTTIKRNGYSVLNTDLKTKRTTKTISMATLNKLKSATAYRPKRIEDLFSGELDGVAQSLAADSLSLYHGTKSKLKERFEQSTEPNFLNDNSAIIIELSPVIFRFGEGEIFSFNDFAVIIYRHIIDLGYDHKRIDVVCDRYFENSLKEQIRTERGVGTRMEFDDDTPFPSNFRADFLHNSENKNQLNEYLAQKIISFHNNSSQQLIVTFKEGVLNSGDDIMEYRIIAYCTSEEADARVVRHARDAATEGFSPVIIRTIDTDVLVLMISYASRISIETTASIFATLYTTNSNSVTWYDINEIASKLGENTIRALPFFYAFTGCDTTSSIFGKGKCKCWDVWQNDPKEAEITSAFIELGHKPAFVYDRLVDVMEYYVSKLYASNESNPSLTRERVSNFERSVDNDLRKIPMSRLGLVEHMKRACLQAGYSWLQCIENIILPNPSLWGWWIKEGKYVPKWQDADAADISAVVSSCTCKKASCKGCKCANAKPKMQCLPFCACRRLCENK